MDRKKRILFLSDYAGAFTGFGKQCKLLLSFLYKTGKYEILNVAQGARSEGPHCKKFPWKTVGTIPNNQNVLARMGGDPNFARHVSYGALEINNIVKDFKPDVIFAVNDTWGSQFVTDQPFFNKIPTVCWNTFDSLPLLQDTIEKASKIKHYWTWSQFAMHELHKLGFNHVKTQYPLVNTKNFYKLEPLKINAIKLKHGLPLDSFIIGFVFRNQLRKLVNTQIEAYSIFKRNNPEIKNTFLYTHTHYSEGWDIPKLCKQYGVNPEEVLCTYVCTETREYFIMPFKGQNILNPNTQKNTLITSNAEVGVTDEQLNEIYNIFSLYSHPATSGACELPCVEAALTEKIVATCRYSFGEDIINFNEGSIAMPFSFYTEHGTQFLKSQPFPVDLSYIFKEVYELNSEKRQSMESDSREWALENYAIDVNGKKIEEFIDSCDLIDFDKIDLSQTVENNPNPNAEVPSLKDNKEWVKSLYKLILDREVTDQDEGLQHWLQKIQQNIPKTDIENYFRKVAVDDLNKNNKIKFEDLLSKNDDNKRCVFVIPGNKLEVFYATSLFKSFKETYPEYNLYVATNQENFDLLDGNEYVHKLIPYVEQMESQEWLEGNSGNKGYFEIAFMLSTQTQKLKFYRHNFKDKLQLEII